MKICLKCLDVRTGCMINYCQLCGKKMFYIGTKESKEAEKRLKEKQKCEVRE